MAELKFKPIKPEDVPAKRMREASQQYKNLVDEVASGRQSAIEVSVPEDRTAKSIYWGLSLYIKKANLKDKVTAVLRDKENKVYVKKA